MEPLKNENLTQDNTSTLANGEATALKMHSGSMPKEEGEKSYFASLGALIVVIFVLVGGYTLFSRYVAAPVAIEPITVRLGWLHQAQFAGFYVAKEKGFYNDVGLDVTLLELDENRGQIEELNQGEVDFSIMEAHQALAGVDGGSDVKAVMAVYQLNPHALAVRADSDIYGPEDFSGKTIGLSGGEGEGDTLFKIFIKKFGNADTVTYKNIGFDTVNDFQNNVADVIDLYSIDQPYLAEREGIPLRIIPLDAYGFSTYGDVVIATRSLTESHPDVVERFVTATLKGWEYALVNQDEAIAITLPYTSGDYTDIDYQRHILQQSTPLIRGTRNELGRMDLVSWSTLYESMRSAGALTRDFDVTSMYTNEFIK